MSLLRKLILVCWLALLSTGVFAQRTPQQIDSLVNMRADSLFKAWQQALNVKPAPPPEKRWRYSFALDGNWTKGNVQRQLLVTRAELAWKNNNFDFTMHPRFAYGKQNGNLAERDGFTDLYVNVLHSRKLYGFGLGVVENSNLREIQIRYTGGGGLGYHFVNNPSNKFSITNAVIYETTRFTTEDASIETLRNSVRIKGSHRLGSRFFSLKYLSFFQPSILNINNIRWSTQIWTEILVTQTLSFRTTFENYYESVVTDSRRRNDTRLSVGLSFHSK